jgi:hypothetical protein
LDVDLFIDYKNPDQSDSINFYRDERITEADSGNIKKEELIGGEDGFDKLDGDTYKINV